MRYARHHRVEREMLDHFWAVIQAMDSGYREWMRSEHDRHQRFAKMQAPKGNRSRAPRSSVPARR